MNSNDNSPSSRQAFLARRSEISRKAWRARRKMAELNGTPLARKRKRVLTTPEPCASNEAIAGDVRQE